MNCLENIKLGIPILNYKVEFLQKDLIIILKPLEVYSFLHKTYNMKNSS